MSYVNNYPVIHSSNVSYSFYKLMALSVSSVNVEIMVNR